MEMIFSSLDKDAGAVQLPMGGNPNTGRDGTQSLSLSLLLLPPRYAVLCGQLAEHEGIQRRIQSGFSFKVRKGFSSFPGAGLVQIPCCILAPCKGVPAASVTCLCSLSNSAI